MVQDLPEKIAVVSIGPEDVVVVNLGDLVLVPAGPLSLAA